MSAMRNCFKIIFIFFVFISCFSFSAFSSQKNIKIGVSLSLTGKYSEMGTMQQKGFKLWQKNVNESGGILGNTVEFLISDDQSLPEKAKSIYEDYIEKEKINFAIGPYSSSISEAILPVIEKNKYPTLLSGASADRLWENGYKYAFGVYTPASKYTVGFLQMLVKHKLKNIAIISAGDTFSISLSKNTEKWSKRFHLNVKLLKFFKKGRTDFSEIATELKILNPDALIVCGHLDESVHMRQALKKVQWYPSAYYASVGPAISTFYDILGDDSEFTFSSSQWEKEISSKYPFGDRFVKLFVDMYEEEPSYHAATAYGAGMILEIALTKAGVLDNEKLRKTLLEMDTMTLIGRYGVDKSGKQRRHFPLIIQWQQGRKKVVWPDEIKTSDPVFK
jgi:branched-chain amino acid transport system substrate-binding protein